MILAKLALGAVGTLAFATVYTFREGTIKIDVDEHRPGGSHVHFWVPAAAVPAALHFVPDDKLQEAVDRAHDALPLVKIVAEELEKYPNADFVQVDSEDEHVKVAVPVSTIQDIIENIGSRNHAQ